MNTLWKLLFMAVMMVVLNQTTFAKVLEGDALRANVVKRLPSLNHTKLQALMQRVGKEAPKGYFQCLCNSYSVMGNGIRYSPNRDKHCDNTDPCKGGNWGCTSYPLPSDSNVIEHCIKSAKYHDNSTIVDAIVGEIETLHEKQRKKYKKLCDKAKIMFPLAHKKYLNNQTKMLWDKKMMKESFDKGTKLYEKESKSKVSINTKFGHADTYLPWLFGHGMNKFGGPLIGKDAARKVSDIRIKEQELRVSKHKLKTKKENFRKLSGAKQSDIRVIEKFWKEKKTIQDKISKKEKELQHFKFLKKRKGYEPALLSEMIKYQKHLGKKLTPGDVLYLSLKQRDGKLNEALLLAHNTLRAIARPGEGNFAVTGVEGNLKLYKNIFTTLREGDNAGPWYHIFGTGFYNVQQRAGNILIPSSIGSSGTNALEQFYREIYAGRTPDPEKFCFNAWGAEVSGEIFDNYIKNRKLSDEELKQKPHKEQLKIIFKEIIQQKLKEKYYVKNPNLLKKGFNPLGNNSPTLGS